MTSIRRFFMSEGLTVFGDEGDLCYYRDVADRIATLEAQLSSKTEAFQAATDELIAIGKRKEKAEALVRELVDIIDITVKEIEAGMRILEYPGEDWDASHKEIIGALKSHMQRAKEAGL